MSNPDGEELDLEAVGKEIDGTSDPVADTTEEVADPAADTQTQTEETAQTETERTEVAQGFEVAGRKYKDIEAFKRAHDHLYRHSSKLEQELAKERKWGTQYKDLEKLWKEHPDLFTRLKSAEAEYFKAREAGATHKEAKEIARAPSVPPEVMAQLKELREWKAKAEYVEEESRLKGEFSSLQAKFKLDDAAVDAVTAIMLEKAEKGGYEISAEDAYEIMLVRQNKMSRTELERVKASADTGASGQSASRIAQKKNVRDMNDDEFNAELEREAARQGLGD